MLQQDQVLWQKFKGAAFSFVELLDATPQFEIALPDGGMFHTSSIVLPCY